MYGRRNATGAKRQYCDAPFWNTHTHTHTYMRAHTHTPTRAHTHTHTSTHMRKHTHTHAHNTHTHMDAYTQSCNVMTIWITRLKLRVERKEINKKEFRILSFSRIKTILHRFQGKLAFWILVFMLYLRNGYVYLIKTSLCIKMYQIIILIRSWMFFIFIFKVFRVVIFIVKVTNLNFTCLL